VGDGEPEQIKLAQVTANFLPLLCTRSRSTSARTDAWRGVPIRFAHAARQPRIAPRLQAPSDPARFLSWVSNLRSEIPTKATGIGSDAVRFLVSIFQFRFLGFQHGNAI
ncbi:MAG: hypothetical protein LAO07_11895, partial [Acidobacteriia bacterium]|nr:hypothetical protein [Terriglobia bacterium]